MRLLTRAAGCALVLLLWCDTEVYAQEATEAQLLFERGAELYRAHRFGEALEAMVASNRLVPNANVVFNVAQIYELIDRPIDAFNWYQRHLGLVADAESRARVEERVIKLLPRVAVLAVETRPAGAELYIERVELGAVGRSSQRVAVQPGDHAVIARLAGYKEARAQANAALGATTALTFELERLLGRIELGSAPQGARVFAGKGGEALGATPLSFDLPVGVTEIVLRLDGYLEQRLEVRVDASAPARHSVQLIRDPARFARLTITADPVDAAVRLDGTAAGAVPLTLEGLSPGVRKLEVSSAHHEAWSAQLALTAGSSTYVRTKLVADADKPWPYYHLVGYVSAGALFAAGAAVGVAAFAENRDGAAKGKVVELNHAADALMGVGLALALATLLWDVTEGPPPRSQGTVSSGP